MKFKGLLILAMTIFIVFIIYLSNIDNKIYYLTLGDYLVTNNSKDSYTNLIKKDLEKKRKLETYVTGFNRDSARITDLMNDIESNKKIMIQKKEKTLKNALIKADMTVVSVGSNDLFYELESHPKLTERLYDKIDQILEDSRKLYGLLRKYCKEDIFVTGFYNPYDVEYDELVEYANAKLEKILKKEDITYIDIQKCISENHDNQKLILSENENRCIADKLANRMKIQLFED